MQGSEVDQNIDKIASLKVEMEAKRAEIMGLNLNSEQMKPILEYM